MFILLTGRYRFYILFRKYAIKPHLKSFMSVSNVYRRNFCYGTLDKRIRLQVCIVIAKVLSSCTRSYMIRKLVILFSIDSRKILENTQSAFWNRSLTIFFSFYLRSAVVRNKELCFPNDVRCMLYMRYMHKTGSVVYFESFQHYQNT